MGRLTVARTAQPRWTGSREARLHRSLKRLGYDLVDTDASGHFHIRREGSKVNETPDLSARNLIGVEA